MKPIHYAIEQGDHARVVSILGADPSQVRVKTSGGDTPLHLAVCHMQPATANTLIAAGADVNARGEGGNTPLQYAAKNGDVDLAQMLIHHGADLEAKNSFGWTPLMSAVWGAEEGCPDVATLLLNNGASLDLRSAIRLGETTTIRNLLRMNGNLHGDTRKKAYLLEDAIQSGSPETVELLLDQGFDPNQLTPGMDPPMFSASKLAAATNDLRVLQALLDHGADPNLRNADNTSLYTYIQQYGDPYSDNTIAFPGKQAVLNLLIKYQAMIQE